MRLGDQRRPSRAGGFSALVLAATLSGCPKSLPPPTPVALVPRSTSTAFALPPADTTRWIGAPLTTRRITDRVVLVEIWTFACAFCRASHPWVADVRARYRSQGLEVLAIHSAQTERERDPAEVAAFAKTHAITWPVFIDEGDVYEALGAQGWPTFVLVDRAGRIRATTLGEAAPGSRRARGLEAALETLLTE